MSDFLIGAATAAHQVEGNNIHSDFWIMENLKHSDFAEPSGLAVDHYNRYEEDIKLLADAGCSAYRCAYHSTTSHTDQRTNITAMTSTRDAADGRADDRAECSPCHCTHSCICSTA